LEDAAHRILLLFGSYAAEYPPAPSGSAYGRTFTLGRLWTAARPRITITGHLLDARLSNATPYGPYVQDPDEQAEVHKGRWDTTDEIVSDHQAEVAPLMEKAGLKMVEDIARAAK
jgi:hypothetical protein